VLEVVCFLAGGKLADASTAFLFTPWSELFN